MEVWTIKKQGKEKVPVCWVKEKFKAQQNGRPSLLINNFFHPEAPALASLVMEELRRGKNRRWIVFSKQEESKLGEISKRFLNSGGALACHFLDYVLIPVHGCWAGRFSATFVREDDPNKSPLEINAPLRLAIQIQGN